MRAAGRLVAMGTLALGLAAMPADGLAAPPQQQDDDCRCVDRDGNAIENCTCFVMPRLEGMVMPFAARPRLGVSVSTDQSAELDAQGARITSVMQEGPAYQAGIREGDLITRIDGQSLLEPLPGDAEEDFDLDESMPVQRLLVLARGLEAGQEVEIEYMRAGARSTATVEAEEILPGAFGYSFDADRLREQLRDVRDGVRAFEYRFDRPDVPDPPDVRLFQGGAEPFLLGRFGQPRYGVELVEVNPELGAYFGTDRGVLVTDVTEGSALGLEPGDIILRVGDRDVTSPDRVLRILATYSDDEQVSFRVRRDGREIDVLGRLEG
jgi:hypothetical protein